MGIRGNTWEYVYSQGFLRQVGIHGRPSGNALVVDLMGEGTSIHDNECGGLVAVIVPSYRGRESNINVYHPCVLNDMCHGNKYNILGSTEANINIQQK